ncbi:MAG: molybdate-binding periplasmic protein [Cyanobacteriota bacterium]
MMPRYFFQQSSSLCLLLLSVVVGLSTIGCNTTPPTSTDNLENNTNQSTTAPTETTTITVSAAASLQDALETIATDFQAAAPEIQVEYNFGSSGSLQQQIEQGAPVDVFFSAAVKQMDTLGEKDLIVPETRRDVVANSLVLIAPQASTLVIQDLAELATTPFQYFAVGEFGSVPAGQYAQEAFEKLDLLEPLQAKFVFGSSVRNVLSAVSSGNAELGIVYATDAVLSDQVKVLLTVPEDLHQPIRYPIAILKNSTHPEASQVFIDFLQEDTTQQTFAEFGFVPLSN